MFILLCCLGLHTILEIGAYVLVLRRHLRAGKGAARKQRRDGPAGERGEGVGALYWGEFGVGRAGMRWRI